MVKFEELLSAHLDRLRDADHPVRVHAERLVARVYAEPGQRVEADWFLDPGADIGVHIQAVLEGEAGEGQHPRHDHGPGTLHDLDCFAVIYLERGRGIHHHGVGREEMRAGDVLLLAPGVSHDVELLPGSVLICVILRADLLSQSTWAALPHARIVTDWISGDPRPSAGPTRHLSLPARHHDDPARVSAMIHEIVIEHAVRKSGWAAVCESHLAALFTILDRAASAQASLVAADAEDDPARAILSWVHKHYADVTLTQLALRFRYSPSHISRLVRRHTGRNLVDIVRDLKLDSAAALLADDSRTVHEVAASVGFSSTSHLHKVFRARYGMSPAEYRRCEHSRAHGPATR